jgi:RpiB/LacA/LacB family sugar-phosphate isomerase
MSKPKIAIGADHGGFELKKVLVQFLTEQGYEVLDVGTHSSASCDYPQFSYAAARAVAEKTATRGIVICKSGIGASIVANKVPGARAAVCNSEDEAVLSREHNDANIIVFGSMFVPPENAKAILVRWLATEHLGGRHKRRVDQITDIEQQIVEGRS